MGSLGVVLQLCAEMADLLRRLDEGAADVVIAGEAELEGNAGLGGVADGRRYAGIGHRHDDVGFDRRLSGQLAADPLTDLVDRGAFDDTVRAREVDVFEDAKARFRWREGAEAMQASVVDDDGVHGADVTK